MLDLSPPSLTPNLDLDPDLDPESDLAAPEQPTNHLSIKTLNRKNKHKKMTSREFMSLSIMHQSSLTPLTLLSKE